jgi:hypothetical protein
VIRQLRISVEELAYNRVQALRERVVTKVADAGSLSGIVGSGLRSRVEEEIKQAFSDLTNESSAYLSSAIDAGIERASLEMGKKIKLRASSISRDTSDYRSVVRTGLREVAASLITTVMRVLKRGGLGKLSLEETLSELSDRSSRGPFDSAKARAAAILSEEVTDAESDAHERRTREIQGQVTLQEESGTAEKKTSKKGESLIPVLIAVWRHSGRGAVPRPHHVAMDGKGVVDGELFKLESPHGTFMTTGPKQPPLPKGDVFNCHCIKVNAVVFVTETEKQKLIAKSRETGGFTDKRWK